MIAHDIRNVYSRVSEVKLDEIDHDRIICRNEWLVKELILK